MDEDRFDPATYDKDTDEGMIAFQNLVNEVYDALALDPGEDGAWDDTELDQFVELIVSDKDYFELAATGLPILQENFVSRTCKTVAHPADLIVG